MGVKLLKGLTVTKDDKGWIEAIKEKVDLLCEKYGDQLVVPGDGSIVIKGQETDHGTTNVYINLVDWPFLAHPEDIDSLPEGDFKLHLIQMRDVLDNETLSILADIGLYTEAAGLEMYYNAAEAEAHQHEPTGTSPGYAVAAKAGVVAR